jgi:hypothetical protein
MQPLWLSEKGVVEARPPLKDNRRGLMFALFFLLVLKDMRHQKEKAQEKNQINNPSLFSSKSI